MPEEFDLVVVGGGPGGYAAALYAGAAGMSVGLVERDKVGGTCLHRGCIPAKELLETATVFRTVAGAAEFGVQAEAPVVDFSVTQLRKQKVVDQLHKGLQGLLKQRKVKVFSGSGSLAGNGVVRVDSGEEIRGKNVIIATGSAPRTLPGFDVDGRYVLTSDEVLALDRLPATAVVVGGGAIGCEFASMMSDLGVQVTVLEALPQILTGTDKDVADVVVKSFKRRGIDVRTNVKIEGHKPQNGSTTLLFGEGEQITADVVVMSVGRRALTEGIGLETVGLAPDERGYLPVDEFMQTGAEGVYAVGDVVSVGSGPHPMLAHVGFAEAIVAVRHMRGEEAHPLDYSTVPLCIYSHPEVAVAGLTEDAARAAGHDVVVSKHRFAGNGRAMIVGETDGLIKVIAEREGDRPGRILGVHMVGPWVTEQLAGPYLAVNWEATVDDVARFIQPHPTLTELFGETVLALTGRGLHG